MIKGDIVIGEKYVTVRESFAQIVQVESRGGPTPLGVYLVNYDEPELFGPFIRDFTPLKEFLVPYTDRDGNVYQPSRKGYTDLKRWLAEIANLDEDTPDWFKVLDAVLDRKMREVFDKSYGADTPIEDFEIISIPKKETA